LNKSFEIFVAVGLSLGLLQLFVGCTDHAFYTLGVIIAFLLGSINSTLIKIYLNQD